MSENDRLELEARKKALEMAEQSMTGMTISVYDGMMQLQEFLIAAYCAEKKVSPSETRSLTVRIPGEFGEGWGTYVTNNPGLGI